MTKTTTKSTRVAEFLAQQITLSGKSQRDIASEVGYENANVITMMKQGLTKIPITKVGAFARALDVDPAYFLRLVLSEYMPETWAAIEDALDGTILTRNERLFIHEYRRRTGNTDPIPPVRSEIKVRLLPDEAASGESRGADAFAERLPNAINAAGGEEGVHTALSE
jgi:transcriptional regulator with XRE-family HTH domain